MNYLLQRRSALAQTLKANDVDAFLVTTPVNVTYLTGFTGDDSFYAVTPKHEILVSDTRYEEQIKEECPDLDAHIRPHTRTTLEAAAEVLTKSGAKSVAVEGNRITHRRPGGAQATGPEAHRSCRWTGSSRPSGW